MPRINTALRYFNEQKELTETKINSGIELNRKGNANLKFKTQNGEPKEITIEIEQVNHEFKFGANIFMLDEFENEEKNKIYRDKFPEIFNLATIPFYWSTLEPEKGKTRYEKNSPKVYRRPAPDLCLEYCKENNIEPKCHCLNYDNFIPEWLKHDTVSEQKKQLEKRFIEIAERYSKDIPSFEVTNETLQYGYSKFFRENDFVDWSFRMADRYFPNNKLIINDYEIWTPNSFNDRHIYYMQIQRLLAGSISHLDSIGMQFHSFFPVEQEEQMAHQRYNPEKLYNLMDLYAKLDIPQQITEMTIPCYSANEEDEHIQAELMKNLYSIFFSHPAMEAIIYWNLPDGYAAFAPQGDMTSGENKFYGGLLRFDLSEKPSYKALNYLINEKWRTKTTIKTIDNSATFRGFYGDYKVKVHADGKTIPVDFKLSKDSNNFKEIVL